MNRDLQGSIDFDRAAFREQVRAMSIEDVAALSDRLRERVHDLAEELQVLSEHVMEHREQTAALRRT